MKKSIYILTLILLNLLTFSSTVNAQILEEDDTITLDIHPNYLATRGRFNINIDNPLNKYFVNINGVIRIDDKSIKLKKKDQPHARIRIQVNKGRLNLSGISKVTKSKSSQGIVEGPSPQQFLLKIERGHQMIPENRVALIGGYHLL